MVVCERVLRKHVECVKCFLRDARSNDLIYAPGSHGEHDRCQDTRKAYEQCRLDPPKKAEKQAITLTGTQAQPLDFYKQRSIFGLFSKEDDQKRSRDAPPCQMELNMHGNCVANHFRTAMTNGTNYIWLAHAQDEAEDKCFNTRASFEKCIMGNRAIGEGRLLDTQKSEPWESRKLSEHFSVRGHW